MTSQDPQWNAAPPVKRSNVNWGALAAIVVAIVVGSYIFSQNSSSSSGSGGGNGAGTHQAPVTITGSGIEKSRTFHLNAGNYRVAWTATPDSDVGCYHGANLESTEVSVFEMLTNELLDDAAPKSGSTNLYGVEGANYYIDASSGCGWSFSFTQQ